MQTVILDEIPSSARYLEFALARPEAAFEVAGKLAQLTLGQHMVIGLGWPLIAHHHDITGFSAFPGFSNPDQNLEVPSSQTALWCWLRGDEPGDLVHASRAIEKDLAPELVCVHCQDAFKFRTGLDLTFYEDGTENPDGDAARQAAFVAQNGTALDGSSFVVVQQWVHNLDVFEQLTERERDHIIGRRLADNEELADAPASAHVKRTAQESFTPEAFLLRRSMPWARSDGEGLMFVAFMNRLEAFEVQMRRMLGLDDGVVDGLFRFSRAQRSS
ncbi:MAG: Dyp-type peroxidase, partial [Pseudomonadota bacterium]